jgi:hypothetical protein
MRSRTRPRLVRGSIVALAAATAYGVVAVALQVPLSVTQAAGDLAGSDAHHHHHHHPQDVRDVEPPAPTTHDHFDCCVARLASSGAPAIEPTEPPAPVAAAEPVRWHPRLQPPRPRPWRASLGRHPPAGARARLAR